MRTAKIFGLLLIILSLVVVAVGFSTFGFIATDATIIEVKITVNAPPGTPITRGPIIHHTHKKPPTSIAIKYQYDIFNKTYDSKFYGIYFYKNFDNSPPKIGDKTTAYVFKHIPEVSVLKRGFDWLIPLSLFLLGISILIIHDFIEHLYNQIQSQPNDHP
ncbi:hypothetical protein [Simiduia agarivorans]|uniref:DUF3592 domain-containing protein n=1 Tax=Simiduia agarivorans (strain DSM 21679 / JCM 13881 / BCRC 17597 / SA1) TaxID=1117647 RepID=K4KF57_SIMAS|nr:hypothetical protein [Simiduia agarivorans]AFU97591.1 hypothetical protein M5M_01850 [Simiduia agarivorans SA1 = DSM 21679]